MRKQIYVVRLTAQERAQLKDLTRKGKSPATMQLKARILLQADTSAPGAKWNDRQISEALGTYPIMCWRVRRQYVKQGLEAVLTRKPRATPPVPPIFDGEKEAKLIALACSPPPPGHAGWSLRLLEDKVVELQIVDRASDNTIGRVLKKTNLSRTASSNGSYRRTKTARS
jgi:homeodomain-containing protein